MTFEKYLSYFDIFPENGSFIKKVDSDFSFVITVEILDDLVSGWLEYVSKKCFSL